MQQEAGVEGGEFDDENDINKSYHDLYVENGLSTEHFFCFCAATNFGRCLARPFGRQHSHLKFLWTHSIVTHFKLK